MRRNRHSNNSNEGRNSQSLLFGLTLCLSLFSIFLIGIPTVQAGNGTNGIGSGAAVAGGADAGSYNLRDNEPVDYRGMECSKKGGHRPGYSGDRGSLEEYDNEDDLRLLERTFFRGDLPEVSSSRESTAVEALPPQKAKTKKNSSSRSRIKPNPQAKKLRVAKGDAQPEKKKKRKRTAQTVSPSCDDESVEPEQLSAESELVESDHLFEYVMNEAETDAYQEEIDWALDHLEDSVAKDDRFYDCFRRSLLLDKSLLSDIKARLAEHYQEMPWPEDVEAEVEVFFHDNSLSVYLRESEILNALYRPVHYGSSELIIHGEANEDIRKIVQELVDRQIFENSEQGREDAFWQQALNLWRSELRRMYLKAWEGSIPRLRSFRGSTVTARTADLRYEAYFTATDLGLTRSDLPKKAGRADITVKRYIKTKDGSLDVISDHGSDRESHVRMLSGRGGGFVSAGGKVVRFGDWGERDE